MPDVTRKTLACGCQVDATRDFLGRVVGTIVTRGDDCSQALHLPGGVIVMPGREHAREGDSNAPNTPHDPNH